MKSKDDIVSATPDAPRLVTAIYGGPQTRGFSSAFADFSAGLRRYDYWHSLAWGDIRARYRRSWLGEFWMAANLAVFVTSVGAVYGAILHIPPSAYLPHLTVGYTFWLLFSTLTVDGSQTFIAAAGILHQQRMPLTVFVLRYVDRAFIAFAHNLVIVIVVLYIFGVHPGWTLFLVIPALVLWWLNGMWVTLVAGLVSARFRDVPQIVANFTQILFLVSPVLWRPENAPHSLRVLSEFNPVSHFLAVAGNPLLGKEVPPLSWAVVLAITAGGWIAAAFILRACRTRVPYWV